MAPSLYLRSKYKPPTNNKHSTQRKFDKMICSFSAWKTPKNKIDKPAEAINATTAGLNADNTVCTPEKLRYL